MFRLVGLRHHRNGSASNLVHLSTHHVTGESARGKVYESILPTKNPGLPFPFSVASLEFTTQLLWAREQIRVEPNIDLHGFDVGS
jgi:hypothetical protein